jgi:hypothetical protein
MSKLKISFSLIIALLLVGILSTSAFAKDPFSLKPTQVSESTDLKILFALNGQTSVDLYVNDSAGVDQLGATNGKGVTTSPVVVQGLTPGVVYNVLLYAGGADPATATPLSKSTGVVIQPYNGQLLHGDQDATKAVYGSDTEVITLDKDGTGLKNANLTGFNNTRKQKSGQKVHGFYQNNTNSCASCHQTHTAANGEYLLFKDGIYSTCSACHDGTTGAYNSFAPADQATTGEIAGTFNVNTSAHNGSLHEADGSLKVSAAPGGNPTPDMTTKDAKGNLTAASVYGAEFDCASCHAAHGAGSAGENNLNADPLGWGAIAYATTNNDTKNGRLFKDITIYDTVPTSFQTPYVIVKKTLADADISADKTKAGYLYSRVGLVAGDKVLQTYRWSGEKNGYKADYSLWLRSTGHVSAPFQNANTLFKAGTTDVTSKLAVVWRDGFAYAKAADTSVLDSVTTGQFSIGIDVETGDHDSSAAQLFDTAATNYVYDAGTEMSKYCASCHIDYASDTRTNTTGTYTQAHRHAVLQDRLTCVRCHYGHGTEATVMKDANDETFFSGSHVGKLDYFLDPNPTSALKRYTGMAVCYACHGKGDQFMGNPNNIDIPKDGDPGALTRPQPTE